METKTDGWAILNPHLADPVRGRIFFELMMNDNKAVTNNQLREIINKGRTTINHHLDLMLEDRVIEVSEIQTHKKGKPTRYFRLDPNFLESLPRPASKTLDDILTNINRNSSHLLMMGNIARDSQSWLQSQDDERKDVVIQDLSGLDFPFYIYTVHSSEELAIYSKHLQNALESARKEIDEKKIPPGKFKHVVVSGFVPVFRTDL